MNKRRAVAIDKAKTRKQAGLLFEQFERARIEKVKMDIDPRGLLGVTATDPELLKLLNSTPKPAPKKKKSKAPEGKVVKECLALLRAMQIFAWRNNTGAVQVSDRFIRYGKKGSADIIGVLRPHGQFFAVECKSSTGKQSLDQQIFQVRVQENGGIYMLVRSAEELQNIMQGYL